jgi:hypothetical protein
MVTLKARGFVQQTDYRTQMCIGKRSICIRSDNERDYYSAIEHAGRQADGQPGGQRLRNIYKRCSFLPCKQRLVYT